jgi:G3E family GTPase
LSVPVPVTVVTGAGDGFFAKASPALATTAFVLNDAALPGDTEQAGPGCVCCRVRGGLTVTLLELLRKRSRGETPPFDRVLVAGNAGEGAQVLLELASSPALTAAFRIDALAASERNDDAAIADHVIGRLPDADARWLLPRALPAALSSPAAIRALADEAVEAFVLGWDEPQPLAAVGDWLHALAESRGERVLRLHGRMVTDEGKVMALNGVRHVVAPPAQLQEALAATRVRFVTRGLEPGDVLPPWNAGAAR